MRILARQASVKRGVMVAIVAYALLYSLTVLSRWLPGWAGLAHVVENLSYDVRAGLAPSKNPTHRVVILTKPDETTDAPPLRALLAQGLPAVRAAGARVIGLDLLLLTPSEAGPQLDAALAASLAGEDTVMAWEMRTGSGNAGTTVTDAVQRNTAARSQRTIRTAHAVYRNAVPFEGLINFQVDSGMGRVLRHVEMWRQDPRAEGASLAARASFAFQVFLVELARAAADRSGLQDGDLRLTSLAEQARRGAGGKAVAEEAVRVAGALRGGTRAAFAEPTAEMLLAQVEYRVLLARAGIGGTVARAAIEAIRKPDLKGFLPVPAQHPRLEWSPDTEEYSRLIVDFHGRRLGELSPFPVVSLVDAAGPARLAELLLNDATEHNAGDGVVPLVAAGSAAVQGRVVRTDGSGAGGVRVLLVCASSRVAETSSGADGSFRVEGLTPGLTRFRAIETRRGVVVMGTGAGPTVTDGGAARLDIDWPAMTGSVNVSLTRPVAGDAGAEAAPGRSARGGQGGGTGGEDVPGTGGGRAAVQEAELVLVGHRVPVRAGSAQTVMVHARAMVSGDSGRIEGLPAGSYLGSVFGEGGEAGGRGTRLRVDARENSREMVARVRARAGRGAVFRGRVEPAGPADIELIDVRDGLRYAGKADGEGRIEVGGLSEGSYMVLARRGGDAGVLLRDRARLEGALVLVGTRLLDDHDYFTPPVDMSASGVLYGVEVHGYVLDNLLTGSGIRDAAVTTTAGLVSWLGVVSTLGVCVAGSMALACFALVPGILAWGFITGGYLWLAWYGLAYRSVWLDVSLPLGSLVGVLLFHMYHHYRVERAKAERRKQIFARFVNPEMVNRILELDEVVLAGDRSQITVLFSDIRGFTSISEGMDPKHLLELLNEYFSLMNPILLKHDGTHDKYIGDAIMGFFGAPITSEDHAVQAVATAVEMLELNEKMRRERPGWFDIGFGINTGEAVTGFVGAKNGAVSYSAIGDTVNLASRLEGLNKEYGTHILISESTYLKARERFECVMIEGDVRVKGKKEAVRVWEVRGRKGEPDLA